MNHPFDYPANLTQESTNSMLERFFAAILLPILVAGLSAPSVVRGEPLPDIRIDSDGKAFVTAEGNPFRPWGVNYDHNESTGGLIEDYWAEDWEVIEEDFQEIRDLGANVIRIHLQVGRFLDSPRQPNKANLERLGDLLQLAEKTGLYLDLTGLGCYHMQDVPEWYSTLPEEKRWDAQARFWEEIANTCRESSAVFCYDLMNEPIVPGKPEQDWLAGELGGKHFVQRLVLDPGDRDRSAIAKAWVDRMVTAIRKRDSRHLVTVGVIPWALSFPGAKPFFYSPEVGENLDFVSVHFYPRKGEVDKALEALAVYQVGKPVVVEETFPLHCSTPELIEFMDRAEAKDIAQGWICFYWGKSEKEYAEEKGDLASALKRAWLEAFRKRGADRDR